jgi:hypothetical protein
MKVISETTFSVPDEGYFRNDFQPSGTLKVVSEIAFIRYAESRF